MTKRVETELNREDFLPGIDVVIFDIDNTLVKPRDPNFYRQYSEAVNRTVAKFLGISLERGKEIADYYRRHYGGGEQALFSGTIGKHFPEFGERKPDLGLLYDEMNLIDPSGQFSPDRYVISLIKELRRQGKKVIALTDSAEGLSRQILSLAGIDPNLDFDLYLPYTRERGPGKILLGDTIFVLIAQKLGVPPERILAIGDSYSADIAPAIRAGMKTCLVSGKSVEGYNGLQTDNIHELVCAYQRRLQKNE